MNACPCCSEQMLRHARHKSIYWFCPHCRQEMPDLAAALSSYEKLSIPTTPAPDRLQVIR